MLHEPWPALPYAEWKDTLATLHLWTQIVGKIRLAHEAPVNHWWQVTLYVTPRGLTTSAMPYGRTRTFAIDFDFIRHALIIQDCDGKAAEIALEPMTVAEFYARVQETLERLDLRTRVYSTPCEIPGAIPFERDHTHASYDKTYVECFHRVLIQADRLCKQFRASYIGKVSPVHFFWGSFDLAVTRFSGRSAPPHPGGIPNMADWVTREAYSHEVSSCGFWPGGYGVDAVFYAYAYPEPSGFAQARVRPEQAFYSAQMKEFMLPYEAVRSSSNPDTMVLDFFRTTYEATANLSNWDRTALERR